MRINIYLKAPLKSSSVRKTSLGHTPDPNSNAKDRMKSPPPIGSMYVSRKETTLECHENLHGEIDAPKIDGLFDSRSARGWGALWTDQPTITNHFSRYCAERA